MTSLSVADCRVLTFPCRPDSRGNLSFIEAERHIPFALRRIYYLFDVPADAERGGHGHRALEQVFIAIHGSFELVLDDGRERTAFKLDRPDVGIYVCPMMWREVKSFSDGAVCLVLASEYYDEADYFRDYDAFLRVARGTA